MDATPSLCPKERRSAAWTSKISILAKFDFICRAMIIFCLLLYIPVYNRVPSLLPEGPATDWSMRTNRDTKIYVQPNNVTTVHQPAYLCPKATRDKKNNLFLLIVVCSSTTNFDRRQAIRETWGSYAVYLETSQVFHKIRDKYNNYYYHTYNSYAGPVRSPSEYGSTVKRFISSFRQLILELAKALSYLVNDKTKEEPEKRFEDDIYVTDESTKIKPDYDDSDYYIHKMLRIVRLEYPKNRRGELSVPVPDYKVVFLLGLPEDDKNPRGFLQGKLDNEVAKYGDVIQEGFVDSYNNLTLKTLMMLKWINNNCGESVRYILKTDDDTFVNVPQVIANLRKRSQEFDEKTATYPSKDKEYLLIGHLIHGAKPERNHHEKWYTPRSMYSGRVYPRFLSGSAYVVSVPAAQALYKAALKTNFFHLEDVYITGMCSARASPRIVPHDDQSFCYWARVTRCVTRATAHRVPTQHMYRITADMLDEKRVDGCELLRFENMRRYNTEGKGQTKWHSSITDEILRILSYLSSYASSENTTLRPGQVDIGRSKLKM